MSRIGKKIIIIPAGVEFKINDQEVSVKGPKGTLTWSHPDGVAVKQEDSNVMVAVSDESLKNGSALWGLTRSIIQNMVTGVHEGFSKVLEVNGVGYKVALQGKKLILNVGFSHPVEYNIPEDIEVTVEKNVIIISGVDKQLVGQVAAEIRSIRKPEPYKGKGIKYSDEVVRRKVGKVMKSAA